MKKKAMKNTVITKSKTKHVMDMFTNTGLICISFMMGDLKTFRFQQCFNLQPSVSVKNLNYFCYKFDNQTEEY
jgi:hypothetical protein